MDNIFNLPALLIGSVALLLCVAAQGTTVAFVMSTFKSQIRWAVIQNRKLTAHALFYCAILALLLSHLLQIAIWAWLLHVAGIVTNPHTSILFSGSTYTTVGFANDTLPLQWQLLAIIMAVSGLFAFAWSTSIMYTLSQQLYPSEG